MVGFGGVEQAAGEWNSNSYSQRFGSVAKVNLLSGAHLICT